MQFMHSSAKKKRYGLTIVIGSLFCFTSAIAGEVNEVKWSIAPYIWLPSVNGNLGARGYTAKVNKHFTDLASHVNVAGMVAFEAIVDDTAGFTGNVNYAKLGDSSSYRGVSLDGKSGMLLGDLALFYRLGKFPVVENEKVYVNWDVMAGARIWDVNVKLDVGLGDIKRQVSQRDTWVDPIVGTKAWFRFNDKWGLELRGDIGGFDIQSKITWSASAILTYTLWDQGKLLFGYRGVGVDYKNSSKGYEVDAKLHGPIIGVQFRF